MRLESKKNKHYFQDFLPTSLEEMKKLGWEHADIIIFSGDAYVDHPSFGAAVVGRVLQNAGYKVAIVPQPNWRDDRRDFKKLGKPRLFFGVSAGAMDSMVNHYTANKRLRHDDAYTPGGKHGMRPDYPTIVYSKILKDLFPDVPVIAGGIEASLRRISHYDYWQDKLLPSILLQAPIDMIAYGMGERNMREIADRLNNGANIKDLTDIPQTAFITDEKPSADDLILYPFDECLKNKKIQSLNFKKFELETNKYFSRIIWQKYGDKNLKINPSFPPMSTEEIDAVYSLPFQRVPHPRYKNKVIPAYEMIRHSVTIHRGCFGGCAFCTIAAHQGKFISSRSEDSIIKEIKQIVKMEDFKGYISDLGAPSANMYKMAGKDLSLCKKCNKPSCLHPVVCKNLNTDHSSLTGLYRKVDNIEGVKKSLVGSGVRYDLALAEKNNSDIRKNNFEYLEELITNHVSGRLKVAPEHTSDKVLSVMRKPSFDIFLTFKKFFDSINIKKKLNQQLIPYFISSHPECTELDMAELAVKTKDLNFHLEQVQDFTPTPMTLASEMFYSNYNPYTDKAVYVANKQEAKLIQKEFFFWYKPELKNKIIKELKKLKRFDIISRLYGGFSKQKRR